MNSGHALIVDDSKTAQHRLRLMLEKFDLDIEIVSSAEEALAHLSYNQPAVIFLDHHMAGMSGMDALKTIKANPSTALLPVIMYTAEKNDVFIGQARALGALDILSKSTLQPSNLERVLASLNIRARDAVPAAAAEVKPVVPATLRPPAAMPTRPDADLQQVRAQVGRLFEIHIAEVRNQIDASTHFIVKRLTGILDNKQNRDKQGENLALSRIAMDSAAHSRRCTGILYASAAAGLFLLGTGVYILIQMHDDMQRSSQYFRTTLAAARAENKQLADTVTRLASVHVNSESRSGSQLLPRAVALMQSADFQFNFDEVPLNSSRVSQSARIITLLAESGYDSVVGLDIHLGNFCLEPGTQSNTWRLARSDMPVTSCKFAKEAGLKHSSGFTSASFQTLRQTLSPIQEGRIRLQLIDSGYADPLFDYPLVRSGTTAGEWNAIAQKNNRIVFRFPELPAS
jgi:CheY-like chemotaxis protein